MATRRPPTYTGELPNKLQQLKEQVGVAGELRTQTGDEWDRRLKRAHADFKEYSQDWEELRLLLVDSYQVLGKWGASVALGWAVIKNQIADLYYKNPDVYVQTRGNDPDRVQERMLRDVINTVHDDCESGVVMKRCLFTAGWAGFGIDWYRHEQEGVLLTLAPDQQQGAGGQPTDSLEGADDQSAQGSGDAAQSLYRATDQRIRSEFVDPRHFRRDPDGRAWDFSDHKWVARRYSRTLQELWEDETIALEKREMLVSWYNDKTPRGKSTVAGETDPKYLDVYLWEIWSIVSKTIIHIPDGAHFDLGEFPWSRALAAANIYPCVMVAFNRSADDEEGRGGWAPIPELRLIRSQLENLNRLEGLVLESATKALNIYFTFKGLIGMDQWATVTTTDNNRQIIEIDPEKYMQTFGLTQMDPNTTLKGIIELMPVGDDQERAFGWSKMIDHELALIYQITGQGPGDRGGIAEADSATEAANIRAQLDKRTNDRVEEVEAAFLRGTNIIWQLLRTNQTLPVPYRSSTAIDQSVWAVMVADDISDLELFFKVAAGSSRPRNRAQVKIDRTELAQKIGPMLLQPLTEEMVAFLIYVITPYEESDDLIQLLRSRLKAQELAAQLTQMDLQISQGEVNGADPNVAIQKQELSSQLNAAVLGPGGIQKVAATMPGKAPQPQPTPGQPNVAAGRSAGQIAAAEAAAGRTNIN